MLSFIRSTPIPSLITLMLLGLIIIWIENLKNLLHLITYVNQIWLGMSILLLVIVKLFKFSSIIKPIKALICQKHRDSTESTSQKDVSQPQNTNYCDTKCSKNHSDIVQTIHQLSQKRYTFSMPVILPLIYFAVCLTVLTIPIIYDITRVSYTMIFVATGIPMYFVSLWNDNLPNCIKCFNANIFRSFQKTFLAMPDKIDL